MNILVVGAGGREHAMAWKIAQSPRVAQVFVAPGNAGTELAPNLTNVAVDDIGELLAFARNQDVALTVVGPEAPLAAGIVDTFRTAGLKIFGPSRAAAQLESSKDYAKSFMLRHRIPTARHRTYTTARDAHAYIDERGAPIVVKADGLAAGKGVVVAMSRAEAQTAVEALFVDQALGHAGVRVVVEDYLTGEEASFIVMVDGSHVLPLASSQDHKRLRDGDEGPNTGGMGAYSPAPVVTPELHERIMREIIHPAVRGMMADGLPYTGFLYAGVMIGDDGSPKVLEFNCRMGDPETQPIMARLESDFVELLLHAVDGTLDQAEAIWDRRSAIGVVMAADGYPDHPRRGDAITGLERIGSPAHSGVYAFHAGTKLVDGVPIVSGGRVLCVTALGESLKLAHSAAYAAIAEIDFAGMQYRRDIGHRALARGAR